MKWCKDENECHNRPYHLKQQVRHVVTSAQLLHISWVGVSIHHSPCGWVSDINDWISTVFSNRSQYQNIRMLGEILWGIIFQSKFNYHHIHVIFSKFRKNYFHTTSTTLTDDSCRHTVFSSHAADLVTTPSALHVLVVICLQVVIFGCQTLPVESPFCWSFCWLPYFPTSACFAVKFIRIF